jgi:hypothetical protein
MSRNYQIKLTHNWWLPRTTEEEILRQALYTGLKRESAK